MNIAVTMVARSSATITDTHTPSRSKIRGSISTELIWNTIVRRKEITAEMSPLLSEVKSDEPKILNPQKRYEKA